MAVWVHSLKPFTIHSFSETSLFKQMFIECQLYSWYCLKQSLLTKETDEDYVLMLFTFYFGGAT